MDTAQHAWTSGSCSTPADFTLPAQPHAHVCRHKPDCRNARATGGGRRSEVGTKASGRRRFGFRVERRGFSIARAEDLVDQAVLLRARRVKIELGALGVAVDLAPRLAR